MDPIHSKSLNSAILRVAPNIVRSESPDRESWRGCLGRLVITDNLDAEPGLRQDLEININVGICPPTWNRHPDGLRPDVQASYGPGVNGPRVRCEDGPRVRCGGLFTFATPK